MFDTIIAEMKNVRTLRKRRAVSPVIATVILVAVTITVAVAVSYWMSGITGAYTSFEKVEIQSAICTYDSTGKYWKIEIILKNSGTKTATLTNVFVNDVLAGYGTYVPSGVGDSIVADVDASAPRPIKSGATNTITVKIDDDPDDYIELSSGTTINIKIHSASGMDYIKLVQLV